MALFNIILTVQTCQTASLGTEVLECNVNDCTVERSYTVLNKRDDSYYYFKRIDEIKVVHRRGGRGSIGCYMIKNPVDYLSIFKNSFAGSRVPDAIVAKIKSNDDHIKITKYWFGHKIEK